VNLLEYYADRRSVSISDLAERLKVIICAHLKNMGYFSILILLELFRLIFNCKLEPLVYMVEKVCSSVVSPEISGKAAEERELEALLKQAVLAENNGSRNGDAGPGPRLPVRHPHPHQAKVPYSP
jgi:hypothetical protein